MFGNPNVAMLDLYFCKIEILFGYAKLLSKVWLKRSNVWVNNSYPEFTYLEYTVCSSKQKGSSQKLWILLYFTFFMIVLWFWDYFYANFMTFQSKTPEEYTLGLLPSRTKISSPIII